MMTLQDPVLVIPRTVVRLLEKQLQPIELVRSITCTDADGDDTRIYLRSLTPSNPCGKCFQVWPCKSGEGGCCR